MSSMPHSSNPMSVARETVAIAKETKSPTFQRVASWLLIGTAAFSAIAGVAHSAKSVYRDWFKPEPEGSGHGRRQAEPVPQANTADEPPPQRESGQERSWVEKSIAAERGPHARHARHAHHEDHSVGGRH